ncbi:MAG: ABC-type multidrug transport system ATPase subunit, partial [Ulvibacter sp.]
DPQGIHQIREIIKKIASEGTTILLASHLLDEVEKVCSHVVILRKGKSLYTGRVDGMNASHGFFIVKSDDMVNLQAELESYKSISSVKPDGENLIAYLNEPMDASELNKHLFSKGITLSHLLKRKESLEEQFLELTKQN